MRKIEERTAEEILATQTRRGFLSLAGFGIAAVAGWEWLWSRPLAGSAPSSFRGVLDANGHLASKTLFSNGHLASEFSPNQIGELRPNGDIGLSDEAPTAEATISVHVPGAGIRSVTLDEIYSLPKTEQITEFKCIEGWSTVVRWGGARFRDFAAMHAAGTGRAAYVSLSTPGGAYYVGIDMASMLHPQTLLCYERNGERLEADHGAPLRLVIPVKYGIKNIKRIGSIAFVNKRPPDYWAAQGYDYYAGL